MDFKRARTEEQKRQRMAAILAVADRLLDEHPYRAITMTMIARELGFSRANLAHYVRTKEEIFLLLYLRDIAALCDDLAALAQDAGTPQEGSEPDDGIERFAAGVAASCARHRNFGRIGAMLASVVETNVDAGQLADCKRSMFAYVEQGSAMLAGLFPFLTAQDAGRLVMSLTHFAAGLYPASHPLDVQRRAMDAAGFAVEDFEESLRAFLIVQLRGYRAAPHAPAAPGTA